MLSSGRRLATPIALKESNDLVMTIPKFIWTKINPIPDPTHGVPCSRSSHGVSIFQRQDGSNALFVYGGEHIARTPLPKEEAGWICDANTSSSWKWVDCTNGPPDRIAHAQAVYNNRYVYIFGGRAGITMQEKAMNDLWVFDTKTGTWNEVVADTKNGDAVPEARSFHRMICIGTNLYVFGGCGAVSGRLNDMYRFDVANKTWHNLGPSKLRGRGGPNLLPIDSGNTIAIIAGFAGEETSDGHTFDVMNRKWSDSVFSSELQGLRPRSVCTSGSFPSVGVSLIFGGEVDPSHLGHEGAGGFENDVVVLAEKTGSMIETVKANDGWPKQRGWSDSASIDFGNGKGLFFVFGGLSGDDTNPERLDDLWQLSLQA